MITIWNQGGLMVILSGIDPQNHNPTFEGMAFHNNRNFRWSATPTPKGYTITVRDTFTHRTETTDSSSTWNLGLEVAIRIQRAL